MIKLRIRKGDEVIVVSGAHKGKVGKVLRVIPERNKAVVSGVNIATKHTKPSKYNEGGIVKQELPIHISNLAVFDAMTGEPTKIGYKTLPTGIKVRFGKKTGKIIDKGGE